MSFLPPHIKNGNVVKVCVWVFYNCVVFIYMVLLRLFLAFIIVIGLSIYYLLVISSVCSYARAVNKHQPLESWAKFWPRFPKYDFPLKFEHFYKNCFHLFVSLPSLYSPWSLPGCKMRKLDIILTGTLPTLNLWIELFMYEHPLVF